MVVSEHPRSFYLHNVIAVGASIVVHFTTFLRAAACYDAGETRVRSKDALKQWVVSKFLCASVSKRV